MEFNIALHTIFYISIFIVPGILLRRCYFSGEFKKEFSHGNLMERFMWTVICSVFVLFLSSVFFYFLRLVSGKKLLEAVSYGTIKEIFELLSENDLPETVRFFEIYKDFLVLIIGIYFVSILLGFLGKRIALSNLFLNYLPVFKFKNYWYYFLRGKLKSAINEKGKQYWYTEADVLIQQDDKTKMYSGRVSDYYVNSTCNQLETIFLEDAKRYKFKEDGTYDLVQIPGDVFYIPFNKILNINLSYVKKEKSIPWIRKAFWWVNESFYTLIFLFLFSSLWVEDLLPLNLPFYLIVFFSLNGWIIISLIRSILRKLIFPNLYKKESLATYFIAIIFFLLQFIWILRITNFWYSSLISIVALIFLINFVKVDGNNNETSKEETSKGSQ